MESLDDVRRQIDAIDSQMMALFERRMELVLKVAQYKRQHNLPVLQPDREGEVIDRAVQSLCNPQYASDAKRLMNTLMDISRTAQKRQMGNGAAQSSDALRVGYQGVRGSFSQEALIHYFGEEARPSPFETFGDVFDALQQGDIDYGVLPIENSYAGAVADVYDLLVRYQFYIVGERYRKIDQCLLGLAGATERDIVTVYSHPQGLAQSRGFLRSRPWMTPVEAVNTAIAAQTVRDEAKLSQGAIASRGAAEIYGLTVLRGRVNDQPENTTRFVVVGKEFENPSDADKISVVLSLENRAGSLYEALGCINDAPQGVNMVKIESRPIQSGCWEYFFYIDFEGDWDDPHVREMLENLKSHARSLRLLGSYRSDSGGMAL